MIDPDDTKILCNHQKDSNLKNDIAKKSVKAEKTGSINFYTYHPSITSWKCIDSVVERGDYRIMECAELEETHQDY